jgi:hypothetical protein
MAPGFLSDCKDRLVADLYSVEAVLSERKPDNNFSGALLVGVGPQIELGDNGLKRL